MEFRRDLARFDLDAAHAPQESNDLQSLTRHWVSERCAPELLPYPTELMDRVLSRIASQIATIEDSTGIMVFWCEVSGLV